jgi:hypothetical protein
MGIPASLFVQMGRLDCLLRTWEKTGHEPDCWQAAYAGLALDLLLEDDLTMAAVCINFAATPHELRPPNVFQPPRRLRLMTIDEMRKSFDELKPEIWDEALRFLIDSPEGRAPQVNRSRQ